MYKAQGVIPKPVQKVKTELFILIEIDKSMHFKNNDASLVV